MMELLSRDDFKDTKIDPNWGPFDYLLHLRFKFNNSVGLKRKRNLKAVEEEDDGDWVAPKLKPKRRRKQENPFAQSHQQTCLPNSDNL
ncbi:hypothetical protein Gohar_015903 [Gossypium harknessii]|uniref:Uncharacterized protein n=1 Tax=Gossypium harknessii TaxID=34285 RepID=A0A7J9G2D3_9ROSI|nr:hypothetical protein [Gossypium harknessii]